MTDSTTIEQPTESDERYEVFPFYAVCDESQSMSLDDAIGQINESLRELWADICTMPDVADKARFSLVGFSTTADVILRLCDLSTINDMPGLTAKGATNYGAAFTTLRDTIIQDVEQLKQDGCDVLRPAVFFLTDGQPTDDEKNWTSALDELTSSEFPYRPNIIAFGFGDANPEVLTRVATLVAYQAEDGVNVAVALKEWARALTKSIISSVTGPKPTLAIPPVPAGFREIPVDKI
jgi:uncharacterized protein YegL